MPGDRPKLSFYRRLNGAQKREYDRSDRLGSLPLAADPELGHVTVAVMAALATGEAPATRRAAQKLADEICRRLRRRGQPAGPAPRIRVLKARPRLADGEFHGLYTLEEDGRSEIRVWMLTAATRQVVKPRTFLRTLLHELVHHFDMTLLDLPSSFHTIGFHARESSLLRVLEESGAVVPGARRVSSAGQPVVTTARSDREAPAKPKEPTSRRRREQLDLFRSR